MRTRRKISQATVTHRETAARKLITALSVLYVNKAVTDAPTGVKFAVLRVLKYNVHIRNTKGTVLQSIQRKYHTITAKSISPIKNFVNKSENRVSETEIGAL